MLQRGWVICVRAGLLLVLATSAVWANSGETRRPPGERRRPPQAAFDACNGKTEGATVVLNTPGGTITATCRRFDSQLVAVPEGVASPPSSGTGPVAP